VKSKGPTQPTQPHNTIQLLNHIILFYLGLGPGVAARVPPSLRLLYTTKMRSCQVKNVSAHETLTRQEKVFPPNGAQQLKLLPKPLPQSFSLTTTAAKNITAFVMDGYVPCGIKKSPSSGKIRWGKLGMWKHHEMARESQHSKIVIAYVLLRVKCFVVL
jgi:hypothetical protein